MNMKKSSMRLIGLVAIAVAALLPLSGCDKKKGGQGQQADSTTYTVRELKEQQITLPSIYPTTLRGKLDVEIRPQVAGPITQVAVDEGANVRKGQLLFVLDQVQFQEAVNAARAAVAVAESQVATAELTAKNNRQLASENIIGTPIERKPTRHRQGLTCQCQGSIGECPETALLHPCSKPYRWRCG